VSLQLQHYKNMALLSS